MQFVWPFKAAYLIVWVDEEYTKANIGVPSQSKVWLLSRKPNPPEHRYQRLVARTVAHGYARDAIQHVPQRWSSKEEGGAMTRRASHFSLLMTIDAALGSVGVPESVEPVRGFELDRDLGIWYEIARLDHRFERRLEDISATYALREDGSITVRNRGFDVAEGDWREALGRARPIGDPDVASPKVSFFGLFYRGYHVIAVDQEAYRYALMGGPDRDFLWILAREKAFATERKQALLAFAHGSGYDVNALIWVPHSRVEPALHLEELD
jgi:apolipoprotein D and lipocalin family protein